ncbi:glycosyltransferase family 87 protein [Aequorivita sp. CIP111184]|uniref:glycosyltransferase family 87 protein n=1 Tax=Aequorivita sp. CIP111184 TaxID=2211356 RepID=UPI000DBC4414|nr:glycosyltransferase family 87 protein [Aequorivita sp. CIP111184]SRX53742.1 Alpha-(1->6)-mannopyranosyltransferase A [Aequorivita sp. CIP111184]
MNFIKLYKIPLLFAALSIAFYISFGYDLERSDFVKLISLYSALFVIAFLFVEKFTPKRRESFLVLVSFGIIFRIVFIAAVPNLSQDFYRFLWDGRLLLQGVSPYLFTPDLSTALEVTVEQSQQLIDGMGALNASHFSNYPPINQLFFTIAALFAGKSILGSAIVLRIVIILADIGILYFGKKILEKMNLPIKNIFWYFLNPFIIIELTGNLHFEGVMLFFFVWGLYLLFNGKWFWAALLIGCSISVKLIPLLYLPLFLGYFINKIDTTDIQKRFDKLSLTSLFKFYIVVLVTTAITFLPFLSSAFIQNFSSTIALWFQNFEFNASIYYVIRWIGFEIVGWNLIETVGKILPVLVLIFVSGIAFFRKNKTPQQLLTAMLFAILFYFLLSTTVHPWYIATPLLLSVFTKYKFPIVWSFAVMLSYSAYGVNGFDEKLWLVALEYIIVIGFAFQEIFQSKFKPTRF